MASRSAPRLVTRRLNFKGQALHVKVKLLLSDVSCCLHVCAGAPYLCSINC